METLSLSDAPVWSTGTTDKDGDGDGDDIQRASRSEIEDGNDSKHHHTEEEKDTKMHRDSIHTTDREFKRGYPSFNGEEYKREEGEEEEEQESKEAKEAKEKEEESVVYCYVGDCSGQISAA